MRTVEELEEVQPRDVPPEAWMKAIAVQLALLNDVLAALFFSFNPIDLIDEVNVIDEEDEITEDTEANDVPVQQRVL